MNPLTEDRHQLAGLLHPNPDYDTLVLASGPDSHIRETRGWQVEHYYAPPAPVVPEVVAIEPTAVHDPPRLAIEAVVQSRPRGRRAVAVQ